MMATKGCMILLCPGLILHFGLLLILEFGLLSMLYFATMDHC